MRPGDITLPGFPIGRDTLIDVAIVNPLQRVYINRAAETKGVAMAGAKMAKRRTYRGKLSPNAIFTPALFETLGGWDEEVVQICKKIGSVLARNQGREDGEITKHLTQRVSVAIQRGTARIILARMPDSENELVDSDRI